MSNLFLLKNNDILDLFEIKLNDFEGYFRFHGSKNLDRDIVFKGNTYIFIPCELSNLEYSSEGKQNRPTITIANINKFITNFIKDRDDLLGKRFYRKKILAKDLDDVNFGGENKNTLGASTFTNFISIDTFIIQKKNSENKEKVEFTLANVLDIDGLVVPSRKVFNDCCQWQYRGAGCNYGKLDGYTGPKIAVGNVVYDNLSSIVNDAQFGITASNLSLWLTDDTGKTIGSNTTVVNKQNQTLTFKEVTAWADQSATIGGASAKTISLTAHPKQFLNVGRMSDRQGVLFDTTDKLNVNSNFLNVDQTIFIVCETTNYIYTPNWNKNRVLGGNVVRGLTSADGKFSLGYANGQTDVAYYKNSWFVQNGPAAYNFLNKPKVFCGVIGNSAGSVSELFVNNLSVYSKPFTGTGSASNIGINTYGSETSEIVVYEIIVFNQRLNPLAIKAVNSYLINKYKIMSIFALSLDLYKFGLDFFNESGYGYEGNLGLPMADENNKLFLNNQNNAYSKYESYGLSNLNYKGDYNNSMVYAQGDFVKIDQELNYDFTEKVVQLNNDVPPRFFICIEPNGVSGLHPYSYTNAWKEDKCSRNLNGCSLRFNNNVPIPYGGFPGTIGYEYRLPNS